MTLKIKVLAVLVILLTTIIISGCVNNTIPTTVTQSPQCTMTNQTDGVLLKCTGDNIHIRAGDREFNYMYPIVLWYFLVSSNQVTVYNQYTGNSVPISVYEGNTLNMPPDHYNSPETQYGWDASSKYYYQYIDSSSIQNPSYSSSYGLSSSYESDYGYDSGSSAYESSYGYDSGSSSSESSYG